MNFKNRVKNRLINYYRQLFLGDKFLREVKRWFKDAGDKNLRLDYQLNNNSVVFDVGGYEGSWAEEIYNKFQPTIYIFEPVPEYAYNIKKKFADNLKVLTFPYGLSDKNSVLEIALNDDNSSFYIKKGGIVVNTEVKEFSAKLLDQLQISKIDLMKINIEGAEYDLLNHMINNDTIKLVDNLQIQFHNFVPGAITKRNSIRDRLKQTHEETWCYEFVWENWTIKSNELRNS